MNEINVHELKEKRDKGEDFQLIDVREDFEYELSNLGAVLIPFGHLSLELDKISKTKLKVVMCRTGKRSGAIIGQLEKLGYTDLYNLKGGLLAWQQEIDPAIEVF